MSIFTYISDVLKTPVRMRKLREGMPVFQEKLNTSMILIGKVLAEQNRLKTAEILQNLQLAEFKVFSQFGDDGIIQFLVDYLRIENKTFVEFGVEDYTEANTRFLLTNNSWRGLVLDADAKNIEKIKSDHRIYLNYDLTARQAFVTTENINQTLRESDFTGKIGLLHIDIDGNDYWVWKEINAIDPDIVIAEYNSVFGDENYWTVPYDKNFQRAKAHYSFLYFGASLPALCALAEEKGYCFIGSNSAGNNAYFIKKEKLSSLKKLTAKEGYVTSKFREGRDKTGQYSLLAGSSRLKEITGLPIYNTKTKKIEKISF